MGIGVRDIEWNGAKQQEGVDILSGDGGMIVSPTKVGYIIITSDFEGLRRKFTAKQRALNKPGVVLCSSMQQLRLLAQMNDAVEFQHHSIGMESETVQIFY
jgi:tRNA A37 threonylcarbamoyladenosine synthetase subunit TsaC/SUA5/YrdC